MRPSARISIADPTVHGRRRQLTNDPRYSDEEPQWSSDGSHILFARTDAQDARKHLAGAP